MSLTLLASSDVVMRRPRRTCARCGLGIKGAAGWTPKPPFPGKRRPKEAEVMGLTIPRPEGGEDAGAGRSSRW